MWVLCTRGTSALQHSSSVCVFVCMRERVSKGGGTLGTPPALQQVVCFYECVCMCVFSSPHTTNGSSSHPAHRPPCPWLPWKHTLSEPPREVHTPPPPPSVHCSLLSPDASVALSPSVPSSLLSSPQPSFPLSRCLSLAVLPISRLAWFTAFTPPGTKHTHTIYCSHTHIHIHIVWGWGG